MACTDMPVEQRRQSPAPRPRGSGHVKCPRPRPRAITSASAAFQRWSSRAGRRAQLGVRSASAQASTCSVHPGAAPCGAYRRRIRRTLSVASLPRTTAASSRAEVALDGVLEGLGEQPVLGLEVVEDQRRAAAERGGDIGDAQPREAAATHLGDGRIEDLLAAHLHLPPDHARTLLSFESALHPDRRLPHRALSLAPARPGAFMTTTTARPERPPAGSRRPGGAGAFTAPLRPVDDAAGGGVHV